METPAPAVGAGNGGENEHGDALDVNSTTEREQLLNRLCVDGGNTAAFTLRALQSQSPTLADPILEQFSRYTDEIDDLECCLLDHMTQELRAKEGR